MIHHRDKAAPSMSPTQVGLWMTVAQPVDSSKSRPLISDCLLQVVMSKRVVAATDSAVCSVVSLLRAQARCPHPPLDGCPARPCTYRLVPSWA